MIHLDTSFLIRALVPGSVEDRRLRAWLAESETLEMSTLAWAEFLCGPLAKIDLGAARQVIKKRVAFSEAHAQAAARLFNDSGRRRGTFIDCLIAAAALVEGAPLATANTADYRPFEPLGLKIL